MAKKSIQKFKYLENEKSFKDKIKIIFHIFKGQQLKQIKRFGTRESDLNMGCYQSRQAIFLLPHEF